MTSKHFKLIISAAVAALFASYITGCGNRGDLYLPDASPKHLSNYTIEQRLQ